MSKIADPILQARLKLRATQKVLKTLEESAPGQYHIEVLASAIEAIVGPVNINIRVLPQQGESNITARIAELFSAAHQTQVEKEAEGEQTK